MLLECPCVNAKLWPVAARGHLSSSWWPAAPGGQRWLRWLPLVFCCCHLSHWHLRAWRALPPHCTPAGSGATSLAFLPQGPPLRICWLQRNRGWGARGWCPARGRAGLVGSAPQCGLVRHRGSQLAPGAWQVPSTLFPSDREHGGVRHRNHVTRGEDLASVSGNAGKTENGHVSQCHCVSGTVHVTSRERGKAPGHSRTAWTEDSLHRGDALCLYEPLPLKPAGRGLWGMWSGRFSLPSSPNF